MSKYGVFSGPYVPIFTLNAENHGVNHTDQKNSVFGYFSRSVKDFTSTAQVSVKVWLRFFYLACLKYESKQYICHLNKKQIN